ncbi:MAG: BREX-1 system adenine-specific DNA-methyltransferase PglX [Macellibacteroides sp.]|uniref:BREX-1 system adenine-specific DNA-methyltransferase PglX n=1 Tax=Macellibacteroides sp. TaxID=2014584 RepID=UPI003E79973D
MNTSALKRFAQQARNILKSGVEKQLIQWGYNPKTKRFETEPQVIGGGALFGSKMIEDTDFNSKWQALRSAVQAKGAGQVVEEAAYTWFNRLMAIRILAKNGYIPAQMEYTSAESRITTLVQAARQGITPRLDENGQRIFRSLIEDDTRETELFSLLITAFCYENELLQRIFGRIDDYTGLLLPADMLAQNGFIELLNTTDAISDEDYTRVELIGWLYQFYISEKKDEVFKSFKNKKKAEAEDIPAATQIFTPNWIVKYMVENTVGRLWLDLNPDSRLRESMRYLVENPDVKAEPVVTEVAEIKLLDPACGSGHILVEGFDRLFAMYREEHYTAREAVDSIFARNLFGLDIDLRAAQLAQFALLLKAAAVDRSVITRNITPHVYAMPDKAIFTEQEVEDFLGREGKEFVEPLREALQLMEQSQNLGSIMKFNIPPQARQAIASRYKHWTKHNASNILEQELWQRMKPYIEVLLVLTQKYEAVAANPPYMGSGNMNDDLKKYINDNYSKSKADLFSVFMEVCMQVGKPRALMGMINMHSWMFLSSFEALRKYFIEHYHFENMLHLGPRTFDELSGEVVQNAAFVMRNCKSIYTGVYYRLVDGVNCSTKETMFLNGENRYPNISQSNFEKIPGSPIAYWVSERYIEAIQENLSIGDISEPRAGLQTSDNERFLRIWSEVNFRKFAIGLSRDVALKSFYKWFPHNKGGRFSKWFGNNDIVINFENDGKELKYWLENNPNDPSTKSWSRNLRNYSLYFKEGLTWSSVGGTNIGARYTPQGFLFDTSGPMLFCDNLFYMLGLINTVVFGSFIKIFSQTLSTGSGDFAKVPYKIDQKHLFEINTLVLNSIKIAKSDWDSRETSWDFQQSPLIATGYVSLEQAYNGWVEKVTQDFVQLHANETELNRIFIDIYGLQDELTPEVKLKDITILQDELDTKAFGDAVELQEKLPIKTDVVMGQLISYAVGCMMGRYRLDKGGLHIAHPNPSDEEVASYSFNGRTFQIDEDGIIPLMDNSVSFTDNALARLKEFFALVWGEEELVNTLNFVEQGLGTDLESYLVKVFWKEHCKRYQKRPIYWLFASPKGTFQVLTYMHRMNRFTVEKIRSHYLLKHISNLENRVAMLQSNEASLNTAERRLLEKLQKDLAECRAYDLELKEVADAQIEFDLDDGVAVNYELFKKVVTPIK